MNGHMDDLFDSPELFAIVEVDQADRVVCQAPGCGHSVYKRIHVVRQYGQTSVYGSDCFARLFADIVRAGQPPAPMGCWLFEMVCGFCERPLRAPCCH